MLSQVSFLPDMATMLAYSIACFVLFVTPGPDMSLFLAKTIAGGRSAGIAAMLGAQTGCIVHTLLVALGLSALIATSQTGFMVLKVVGALYLLWLAIDAIRNGSALSVKAGTTKAVALWPTYLLGLGINLTNPKIVLFFLTFLPQFVAAGDPNAMGKLVFLGVYYVAFCIPLAILMILGAESVIAYLKSQPKILRGIDFTFAGVFGYFAFHILTTQGR